MSGLAGMNNANLRIVGKPDPELPGAAKVIIDLQDDQADSPDIDDSGNVLRITHPDGAITVSLDGKPLGNVNPANDGPTEWFGNLAEKIDQDELSRLTEDLLQGIADDLQSRAEWI